MKHHCDHIIHPFLVLFAAGQNANAQTWDYLDVPQGFETLNLAVEGDTTRPGCEVA